MKSTMLTLHSKQHIRFVTVEKATGLFVYAILLETTGNETLAVSEPKLVKIIPKKANLGLAGTNGVSSRWLVAPIEDLIAQTSKIASPYFAFIFGSEASNFITGIAPQPPTR